LSSSKRRKDKIEFYYNGNKPRWAAKLCTWGEAGVVKLKTLSTAKLEDRGRTCMFFGYADDHSAVCDRMWDPKSYSIHDTRDVVWLRCMFFPQSVVGQDDLIVVIPNPPTTVDIEDHFVSDDEAGESPSIFSHYWASSQRASSDYDSSSNAASDNDSTDSTEAEDMEKLLPRLNGVNLKLLHDQAAKYTRLNV
jgi:hypothetical protein